MLITKKRIRNLEPYTKGLKDGCSIIIGVSDLQRYDAILARLGFSKPPQNGESLLPSPHFGPVSLFNAEGKQIIHKDRPKETAYRTIEWRWNEWHGPERVEKSDFRDVPY